MKIQIPKTCPSCSSELKLINSQLFCENKSCSAQSTKKIENFTKTMKIKGLGPSSISKLEIESIPDIFYLPEDYIIDVLGEKIGKKIYNEIQSVKKCEFSTFLSALGIPLIGKTAAEKVVDAGYNSIEDLMEEPWENQIIGPKADESLFDWLLDNEEEYVKLPLTFTKVKPASLQLGKVCITGKLKDFKNREEAGDHLKSLGYNIVSSVTKNTNYLVDEEGKQSSKRKKAEQLNIDIMSIKQLEEKVNYE